MKKVKIIMPSVLATATLAGGLLPLSSCKGNSESSKPVTPEGSKEQKIDESGYATFKFKLSKEVKSGRKVSVSVTSGDVELKEDEVTSTNKEITVLVKLNSKSNSTAKAYFDLSVDYIAEDDSVVRTEIEDLSITYEDEPIATYSITTDVKHGKYSGASEIKERTTVAVNVTPNKGYKLPETVNVSGASYTYNQKTGVISLSNPTSNVTIFVECEATSWQVTTTITNGTSTGATEIKTDGSAIVTLKANEHYELPDDIEVVGAEYTYYKSSGAVVLSNPIDNVTITVICIGETYTITNTITDGTASGDTTIQRDSTATVTLTANKGYELPETVTVSGASYTYNQKTGVISLSNPTGPVTNTATCIIETYTITNNITGGTASGDKTIQRGSTAIVTITPSSGYELPSSITVSGATYTYSSFTGVVSLSNATGNVTISATCVATSITISGEHNIECSNSTATFTAEDIYGTDISSSCTWTISDKTLGTFSSNTLTLTDKAQNCGGSATITATLPNSVSDTFEIELGTFSKLCTDTTTKYCLQNGYAGYSKTISKSTKIVIPSRYYDEDSLLENKWVDTIKIPNLGLFNEYKTSVYVGKNIYNIGSQVLSGSITQLVVDENNETYESPTTTGTENYIVAKSAPNILLFGCTGTEVINNNITEIASNAFYNASLTSVTIPSSVTKIGSNAFEKCYDLKSVTIENTTSTWKQTSGSEIIDVTNPTSNATNLKNCDESETNNWGYTGIETAKAYNVSASITNGTADPESPVILSGGSATINITPNAGYSFPTSVQVENADFEYNASTGIVTLSNPTDAVNITAECPYGANFATCEWSVIIDQCNKLEDGTITTNEFCEAFGKTDMSDFVGLERSVTINGITHIVRVIDTQHDDLADESGKAALTFELKTLLSGSDGKAMISKWDATNNYDYTNSILRKNLTNMGSASGDDVWESSAYSMLTTGTPALSNNIKKVTKSVRTTSSYTVDTYEDYLFPLSLIEMAIPGEVEPEGSQYLYWTNHSTLDGRIKKDGTITACSYWLASPFTTHQDTASAIGDSGFSESCNVNSTECGVSFGFCI